jgi:hypothetical protein
MEARKLSQEEIDKLFELCEFHNVHYYDVQIELVDHLASSIEVLWETNPQLSFKEAAFQAGEQFKIEPWIYSSGNSILPQIFGKKFSGENGFEIITQSKEKELRRKYDRLQLKYIAEFFKLPKVILTLAITFLLHYLLRYSNNSIEILYIVQFLFILGLTLYLIFIYPKKEKIDIRDGLQFLLVEHSKKVKKSAISITISSYNIIPIFFKISHYNFNTAFFDISLLAAFLMTLIGIMTFAICVYTPQRIKADFIREYPQFVKA